MNELTLIIKKKNYYLKSRYVQESQSRSKHVPFLLHRVIFLFALSRIYLYYRT
jgi:hypothetical protein